ncbi:MAG: hypothetical protein Nkreftii_000598 [Candidatus Nitrospira kreftii]|uniref:LamG-like jellyroll fold domain-containing protein n=1 Tax=Candidatus Nitrospira kreftii TaxID=2652173 RepID=A0A7S8FB41_9BACT|nr:MAG: hypothetical protein Nkreftii_000598 [Candidatus Nitrospira kreftii]
MMLRYVGLIVFFVGSLNLFCPSLAGAASSRTTSGYDTGRFALAYAQALAQSQFDTWAAADLGCLTHTRAAAGGKSPKLTAEMARRCWDETVRSHTTMVAQHPESGVFNARGSGVSLGLLHDRHRATENWKEYPLAIFVSPPIVQTDQAPVPQMTAVRTSPEQRFALSNINEGSLVSVPGYAVDIKIVYPDPLTAPLALRPEEIWWGNGSQRQFGPVHEVVARYIVVTGLRKLGFPTDRAVMNEGLLAGPLIATTHYGLRPDNGRKFQQADSTPGLLKGELVPGSARWWNHTTAEPFMQAALNRAAHLTAVERTGLLTRLLLIDPEHADTHSLRGDDGYQAVLQQGITKGGLAAQDKAALQRITELYWTIQAQTWRQEVTAVSEGYEPAADALYRALASYESVVRQNHATLEQRRRLGMLTRWNNDPTGALGIHEALLHDTTSGTTEYERILAEIAWDRIQFVSWNRRYDHPWLQQALAEAEEAGELLTQPYDRLHAHYAQVAVESLSVPRHLDQFRDRMRKIKQDLVLIPGVKGLHEQLVANDLVKSLSPETAAIVLPSPSRSPEVLDVAVHANPPKQDILWQWNFDQDQPGYLPTGFVQMGWNDEDASVWQVQAVHEATGEMQRVVCSSACPTPDCVRLLVAEHVRSTYPDVTVQVRAPNQANQSELGIAIAVTDPDNYYAITLQPETGAVTTRRVINGRVTVLGQVTAKLAPKPWHTMRVQRINFLHLDKGRLAVYVDGAQVAAVEDTVLPQEGRVGLIASGPSAAQFDGLHVLDLVSNRTFSKPAAY